MHIHINTKFYSSIKKYLILNSRIHMFSIQKLKFFKNQVFMPYYQIYLF